MLRQDSFRHAFAAWEHRPQRPVFVGVFEVGGFFSRPDFQGVKTLPVG